MSTSTVLSASEHEAMQELLPCLLAGTLAADVAARLEQHVQACSECRAELAWQRAVQESEPPLPAGLDMEGALARLLPQLEDQAVPVPRQVHLSPAAPALQQPATLGRPTLLQRWQAWLAQHHWQRWAMGAQFAAIALLVLQLPAMQHNTTPAYQALGNGAASMPDVLVVFRADARLDDIQQLLRRHAAQIVGGPTVTGAYMLEVEPRQQTALLAALQADPGVASAAALTAEVPVEQPR